MREFGPLAGADTRAAVRAAVAELFEMTEPKRAVRGHEFAMDEQAEAVVAWEVKLRHKPTRERMRVAATEASARPPFEWLYEITSDVGEADYFKHYLVREDDIVLAQRKVLTLVDEAEAEVILADLKTAKGWASA